MAKVTDLDFYLDDGYKKKLDLFIRRLTIPNPKKDAILLIEGGEGEGKTNLSFQTAYYVAQETGRKFDNSRVFFRAEPLLNFLQNSEEQIAIYDEPALDMLGAEWWKQEQINIVKLLMMARKKRHFIIFNITKFYKFNEYIIVDRALGLVHVYSRNEIEPGRFVYIKKKAIELLYNSYRSSKKREYKRYTSLRGTFADFVPGILDYEQYEKDKDNAILSIGVKKDNKEVKKLNEIKEQVGSLKFPILTQASMAEQLGITPRTLQRWATVNKEV